MKKIFPLLALIILCYSSGVKAQKITQDEILALEESVKAGIDPYFVETTDTVSIHGPKCIVRDVLQDRKGNYWFATWNGIISYDGKVFTNYTLKNNLIHFHVVSLFEDSKGNLWFGTARGGMYRYDGKLFKLFTRTNGLPDNTINCFAEDNNGNMWFATENGLSRYDGKTFTNFTTINGLNDNYINSIIQDKSGKIWVGTNRGINCYDGISFTGFIVKADMEFLQVVSLLEDKAGNIWIGSGKGLFRYDGKNLSDQIKLNFVMYLRLDKKGNLLMAFNDFPRNNKFALYRYEGMVFNKITEQKSDEIPAIFGMIEDGSGNIWFGTNKGVCRYNRKIFTYFID